MAPPLQRAVAALAALWLAACSSTPVAPPPAPAPMAAAPAPAPRPAAPPAAAPAPVVAAPMDLPAHLDPNSPLSTARSVYFGFDEYSLPAQYAGVVERHGGYLMANPGLRVRVEGHTDERGGTEYNLALGQRRAEAVRQALRTRGVPDAQVEAVSFGKERPRATGSSDEAWAQNRRADITYPQR